MVVNNLVHFFDDWAAYSEVIGIYKNSRVAEQEKEKGVLNLHQITRWILLWLGQCSSLI